MGAVDLRPPDRQPAGERPVQLGEAGEVPAGQDVLTHDQHLPLDPAFPGRAVGRQRVDDEAVVLGERGRLRVQRDGLAGSDVPLDDGLGPVVDDRARDPTEVRERPTVAVPERREVHRGREARERIARVGQRHVERVGLRDPDAREHVTFLAPVDLSLRPGDDLEPAVQPPQRVVVSGEQFVLDQRPDPGQVHLHALVMAGETVISDQPFVDDAALQAHVASQPGLDQRRVRGDDLRLRACSGRRPRGADVTVSLQVLLHRAGIDPALTGDLGIARTCFVQHAETADNYPVLRTEDHGNGHPSGSSTWRWTNRRVTPTRARTSSTRRRPTYTSARTPSNM